MNIVSILDRPIAFHRSLVKPCGSINAALFLSQAIYWTNRIDEDRDGWFYKTHKEWTEETGLTRREQDGARAKLRAANLLEEVLVGNPARLHFRVSIETLEGMHQTAKLDAPNRQTRCTKPPNYTIRNKEYTKTTLPPKSPKGEWEDFCKAYPKRKGAGITTKAREKFESLCKNGVNPNEIVAAARAYANDPNTKVGTEYVKQPITWLNQKCYLDTYEKPVKNELPGKDWKTAGSPF